MPQKPIWIRGRGGPFEEEGGGIDVAPRGVPEVRRRKIDSEIERRIRHLPAFPTILSELIGLTSSDTSAAKDLKECVEKDPVLTARLLRLANSAFYSPRLPVTSVQQAVVMLGQQTVKSLAMAAATLKFLGQEVGVYGMVKGGLWMHSYVTAELARRLAQEAGWMNHEQDVVFAGGLLHDIGKIVLARLLDREGASRTETAFRSDDGPDIEEWEESLCGHNHASVGERIARAWRLAEVTTQCIARHHRWAGAPDEFSREVNMVALANVGAERLGTGLTAPDERTGREAAILETFGLTSAEFHDLLDGFSEKACRAEELYTSLGGGR